MSKKHLRSRGDPLCKNLMRARHLKCFSTLRYNGECICETIGLVNWRHLFHWFFFLFSPVSLVSVKTFNRCLIETVRNCFPIMYCFNYLMVFSDLSWILHFIEINNLLHFKVLYLNSAYLLITFLIGILCKKLGRGEKYRRQDRTLCCFRHNGPFFRRFHLKVEV